jgi:putative PIN family toxin of toxin-antitoxin system
MVEGTLEVVSCLPLLEELHGVLVRPKLQRKHGITAANADRMHRLLHEHAVIVPVEGRSHGCRDPKDDVLIETAIVGVADAVVTRDRDLLDPGDLHAHTAAYGIRVLTVRQLLDEINDQYWEGMG